MTTPWRSVQDAEKANETVAWQALPCRLSGGRVSKHRKLALAHVIQLFAAKWRKMRRDLDKYIRGDTEVRVLP
jgi:hypothetical protein